MWLKIDQCCAFLKTLSSICHVLVRCACHSFPSYCFIFDLFSVTTLRLVDTFVCDTSAHWSGRLMHAVNERDQFRRYMRNILSMATLCWGLCVFSFSDECRCLCLESRTAPRLTIFTPCKPRKRQPPKRTCAHIESHFFS